MEKRKNPVRLPKGALSSSSVPRDYLKLVEEVFTKNFEKGLKDLEKLLPGTKFEANGEIFQDEIVLAVSLTHSKQLFANTVYASADYDPKASSPKVDEILASLVDAAGSLFHLFLSQGDESRLEQLTSQSLSSVKDGPFIWTEFESNKKKVFLKFDKSNPSLERMADDFLKLHDPLEKFESAEDPSEDDLSGKRTIH